MISDEMRELLSAYVDGELRDSDAARVEDVSKRDPELRREIEAYRTLRRKLREWDEAEHGAAPSPAFMTRALARARTVDTALAAPARATLWRPLAMAAGLLLAVGAGYGLARSTAPGAPPVPPAGATVAVHPLAPMPDLSLEGSALAPKAPVAPELVHRMRIYDHIPSRRAVELEASMRQEELLVAKPPEPGTRTRPPLSAEVSAMIGGFAARAALRESLVVLARPASPPGLVSVRPIPSDERIGQDGGHTGSDTIIVRSEATVAMISPLGEIWVGPKTGRTRFACASEWIEPRADNFIRMVWGDGTEVPKVGERAGEMLGAQETILGPKARRRLLAAKTADAEFLAWLKQEYGAFPAALAADARDRERAVNKFMDALRGDEAAAGFAVVDTKGNVLGIEIFRDHRTMLEFAPRLLRGYLHEAGEDGIRATAPVGGGALLRTQGFLDSMPGRGLRVDRQKVEGFGSAPEGLCRVNLVSASGGIAGHGLLIGDTPIHLTIFGE
jgi:anti-sigma factor RsiW